jgi:hypothetical protein
MPPAVTESSNVRQASSRAASEANSVDGGPLVATPDRSPSQRLEALKLANAVRTERATLKRDLKAGRVRIETILLDPPECVHSAKVADIMLAVPRYGRVKVAKVLQRCRISPSKTVIGLSDRQRGELVDALHRP